MHYSPEAGHFIAAMYGVPHDLTISGTNANDLYQSWVESAHDYACSTGAAGMPARHFYIAVQLPRDKFSEKMEWHEELPMLIPGPGTKVLGIFGSKAEVDEAMADDDMHVHLVYKCKIQGHDALVKLLEFMATHNMLEKE